MTSPAREVARAAAVDDMTAADVAAVRDLADLDPVTARRLAEHLDAPGAYHLVARASHGGVVGYIGAAAAAGEAHILDVVVHPEHRGQGRGRQLVMTLLARLAAAGITDVTLEVRPSNGPALALYRRCGFVPEGRRPRYYRDGEDAILMWRR